MPYLWFLVLTEQRDELSVTLIGFVTAEAAFGVVMNPCRIHHADRMTVVMKELG